MLILLMDGSALFAASAEAVTAWATVVLVVVTAAGLGFTALGVRAAAAAAKSSAELLKLETEPYIIVEKIPSPANEDPNVLNSFAIYSLGGAMTAIRVQNRSGIRADEEEKSVSASPAAYFLVKNIGRSPAVRLRLEVASGGPQRSGQRDIVVQPLFSVGFIELASLSANETIGIWLFNMVDQPFYRVVIRSAFDDPTSPAIRGTSDETNSRELRCASLNYATLPANRYRDA